MLLTFFFLHDTTGLDLKEQERRWQFIRAGREQDYHGVAIHPKHLSLWERWRGVGKHYDANLDYKQKIEEMRNEWEEDQAAKVTEQEARDTRRMHEDSATADSAGDSTWSDDVSTYYKHSKSPFLAGKEKYANGDESPNEKLTPDAI